MINKKWKNIFIDELDYKIALSIVKLFHVFGFLQIVFVYNII